MKTLCITVEADFADLIKNNFVTEHLLTKCKGYYRKQTWFKFDHGKQGLLHQSYLKIHVLRDMLIF